MSIAKNDYDLISANISTANTISRSEGQQLSEQSSKHKTLSSMKYRHVGRQDDLKTANLNRSENIRDSKKSNHQTQAVSDIRVRTQIEG